jgi:hypothetical protein
MHSDQTQLQLRKFADALATLKDTAADDEDRKTRDSLLLRYVYTFEMAWQSMRAVSQDRGDDETPRVALPRWRWALSWATSAMQRFGSACVKAVMV